MKFLISGSRHSKIIPITAIHSANSSDMLGRKRRADDEVCEEKKRKKILTTNNKKTKKE